MLIQSEFVDLNTPTGIMRTYVHKPLTHKKTPQFSFIQKFFSKQVRLNVQPKSLRVMDSLC